MNQIQIIIGKIDRLQQTSKILGFTVGVIKKYGDDEGGRHAALLTYYLFTSLFPLLLILTTLTERLAGSNSHIGYTIISGLTNYFPLLGSQLASHVQGIHRSVIAMILGFLFIIYGTRGVADSFGRAVRKMWGEEEKQNLGIPKTIFKNVNIVIGGGTGFIAASICAGLATADGHGWAFRFILTVASLVILFGMFTLLINACLPRHITIKQIRGGAATSTIGLVILQLGGGFVLGRELKNLDALYSYFALALGLLFWLYLQVQVIYYAIEISVVSSRKLWPRKLT